jgi:hypothetical protein
MRARFRDPRSALVAVKLAHTAVWAFFVSCILALPILAVLRRFDWAVVLSAFVLVECGVLALNSGRCPLTDVAARYTPDRAANFDIYLPLWLARHNKVIFGVAFVVGEMIVVAQWVRWN